MTEFVPMLGSEADGEALAEAHATERTLDMHDHAASIATAPAGEEAPPCPVRPDRPPAYRPPRRAADVFTEKQTTAHRCMARYCRNNDRGRLSQRERSFVWSIARRGRELTIPQADWLADITDRLEQGDQ